MSDSADSATPRPLISQERAALVGACAWGLAVVMIVAGPHLVREISGADRGVLVDIALIAALSVSAGAARAGAAHHPGPMRAPMMLLGALLGGAALAAALVIARVEGYAMLGRVGLVGALTWWALALIVLRRRALGRAFTDQLVLAAVATGTMAIGVSCHTWGTFPGMGERAHMFGISVLAVLAYLTLAVMYLHRRSGGHRAGPGAGGPVDGSGVADEHRARA